MGSFCVFCPSIKVSRHFFLISSLKQYIFRNEKKSFHVYYTLSPSPSSLTNLCMFSSLKEYAVCGCPVPKKFKKKSLVQVGKDLSTVGRRGRRFWAVGREIWRTLRRGKPGNEKRWRWMKLSEETRKRFSSVCCLVLLDKRDCRALSLFWPYPGFGACANLEKYWLNQVFTWNIFYKKTTHARLKQKLTRAVTVFMCGDDRAFQYHCKKGPPKKRGFHLRK